jgi:hypothetical protein
MAEPANRAAAEALLGKRIAAAKRDLAGLRALWHQRSDPALGWVASPDIYRRLARAFIEIGAPLPGLEVVVEGLDACGSDLELRQLQGLALARSGDTGEANRVLEGLRVEGHLDDQTLGMLARTHKDLGLAAAGAARRRHLQAARDVYAAAFESSGSYWTGINLATLSALLGDKQRSQSVARDVMASCRKALETLPAAHPDRYWALATLGEAGLVEGDVAGAARWYKQAASVGSRRFGDLNSTRRHAFVLLEHHGEDPGLVEAWLPLPRVVIFSGHMIDRPGRTPERFPARMEAAVRATMVDWLSRHNALVGFSSAACGADILFQEALEELGGERHVVLPYLPEEFAQDSVEIGVGGDWRARYDRVLESAGVVIASSSRPLGGGVAYEYANHLVHGLGLVRAAELDTQLCGFAAWDGRPGDGSGGTTSAVSQWLERGVPVEYIALGAAARPQGEMLDVESVAPAAAPRVIAAGTTDSNEAVMALLFADAVGFSGLSDVEVPLFVSRCLGRIAELVAANGDTVTVRETWGDGLFLAFTEVRAAGMFALALLDLMKKTDWVADGFSRPLAMRLALHAGPVHLTKDPVTGLPKCCGTHVSRAARLEPKTPAGQVYASEAFAALVAMDGVTEFRCEYVKELEWAKRYGTFPAYVVRRND